jgi:PAS domain S-box-containing protein
MIKRFLEIIEGQQLSWLLNSAADALIITDIKGQIILANPPALNMFGYVAEELNDTPIETLLPERIRHAHIGLRTGYLKQPVTRAMGSGKELSARRKDGTEFPVEVSLSPLQTERGVALVMATVHDISLRKQAESALKENEARIRAIVDTAVDAIITIDETGIIERFNPAAQKLFGYSETDIKGKNVSSLMPAPFQKMHDGYLSKYLTTGEKKIIGIGREVTGLRKDGTVFPMDLSIAEMRIGERRMFTGIVRDVSERRAVEQALRKSQEELRQLAGHLERTKEDERKRIAREIHDELGGIMAGIKAYVSVVIEREARAGKTPEPLLIEAAALADTGFQAVRRVIADLRPSVLDQLGVWAALESHAGQISKQSNLQCTCRIEDNAAAIEPDPETSTMLFRVVQEALTNAVRHAQASAASIHVSVDGEILQVCVQDDGNGIDTSRQSSGVSWGITGMGERALYFGGVVTVSGAAGQGTCVKLRIPLEKLKNE